MDIPARGRGHIYRGEVIMSIATKHLRPETAWRGEGYIDTNQVDYSASYALQSKPSIYGNCVVFQHVVMNDGTIYELRSDTASTRGIIGRVIANTMTMKDVKRNFTDQTMHY